MRLPPATSKNMANLQYGLHQAARKPCLLCGRLPMTACTWFPSEEIQSKLNVPGGKFRTFYYSLCGQCYLSPNRDAQVEATILSEYFKPESA